MDHTSRQLLLAYLVHLDSSGYWTVSTYREFGPLQQALARVKGDNRGGAAVHVGFDALDDMPLRPLLQERPGQLLYSEAALHALPVRSPRSVNFVAALDGLHFCSLDEGVSGNAQEATGLEVPPEEPSSQEVFIEAPQHRSWLARLMELDSELAAVAASSGIRDEQTWSQREDLLEIGLRRRLAWANFTISVGAEPSSANMLENLQHVPPWLQDLPLSRLRLTVRQANVFRAQEISTVRDLGTLGRGRLLKLPNLGEKSINDLADLLARALREGPPERAQVPVETGLVNEPPVQEAAQRADTPAATLAEEIAAALQSLSATEVNVLVARMGLTGRWLTLKELAEERELTRERIRQIEGRACRLLMQERAWELLERRLEALLDGAVRPAWIDALTQDDPWFNGLADPARTLEYLFERFLGERFHVMDIDGRRCVSRLSQAEWEANLVSARRLLEDSVPDRLPEDQARGIVSGLVESRGRELLDELWVRATEAARFVSGADGVRYLAAFGQSAEAVVKAVLSSSDRPLHFTEIHERSTALTLEPLDLRRVQSAALAVGVLFARGTYGLPSHIPLNEEELELVRAEVERLVATEPEGRQWHCSEFQELLGRTALDFGGRLNEYVIDFALQRSETLVDLGRLVWGVASASQGKPVRMDLRQSVIAILEVAGGPLNEDQIRERLDQERGVSEHFQIFAHAPLVRLGSGQWGLIGRDIPRRHEELETFAHALKRRLLALEGGVPASEMVAQIEHELGHAIEGPLDPQWVAAVGRDTGIRLDRRQVFQLRDGADR